MNTVDLTHLLFNQKGLPLRVPKLDEKGKPELDADGNLIEVNHSAYEYITGLLFNYSNAKDGHKRKEMFELYMKLMRAQDKTKIELMADEQALIKLCLESIKTQDDQGIAAGVEQQILWLIEGRDLSLG